MIFVTVSYRGDLDRLRLLVHSMDVFYQGVASHIIIVPREDITLFSSLSKHPRITILTQNELVDDVFYPRFWYGFAEKILGARSWRLARYAGRSGWIIQQIVKLALPAITEEKDIVVIDSDVVFIRQFNDGDFVPDNAMHLLVKDDPDEESARHRKHMANSRQLLKLSQGSTDHHYLSCPVVLNRDWLLSLHGYIEKLYERPWQLVLNDEGLISEYCIYGVFVEEILKPDDLCLREKPYNLGIWSGEKFFETLDNHLTVDRYSTEYLCLTIQSNLGVSVDQYEKTIMGFLAEQ